MGKNSSVKVLVLRTAGTNCNEETASAFAYFGAKVEQVHINKLVSREVALNDYHIVAMPGGFSYGDDIASGRILANELRLGLAEDIRKFIGDKKLVIGICNGFQILVKTGFLPGPLSKNNGDHQDATLTLNDSAKFESRWTCVKTTGRGPWLDGLKGVIEIPVAHGEGKFVPRDKKVLERLKSRDQIAFTYCDTTGNAAGYPVNPNGSVENIAGITDETGQILGLMPHPERHFFFTQNPAWTRKKRAGDYGDGAKIFENGVRHIRENVL